MSNILFVRGKARMRSPTAAAVCADLTDHETDFAGLSADANERITAEHLAWADTVVVTEKRRMSSHMRGKRLVCLDIPDTYAFMQPELIDLIQARLPRITR